MTAQSSWDPDQYLRFGDERLRPALDLLAHIGLERPRTVVDLGCGAGNVSAILKQRFPAARVLGVDGSAAMLEKARAAAPDCDFVQADMANWTPEQPPDLIYSNAALHWVPDHQRLFPRLMGTLASGGVLAVQMPAMHNSPMRRLQGELAASGAWAQRTRRHFLRTRHPETRAVPGHFCARTPPRSICGKRSTFTPCRARMR